MIEVASFEWGWDALVALGTMALAIIATVALAWATRGMVKATARDVAAQWRPAIAPGELVEVSYRAADKAVSLAVRNVGRGAAYYVDAGLDLGGAVVPAAPWSASGTEPTNFAVLPANESLDLEFRSINGVPETCELIIDYEDVAHIPYSTRIHIRELPTWDELRRPDDALRMDRVELYAGRELIPWKKPPSLVWRLKRACSEWWRRRKDGPPRRLGGGRRSAS